MTTLVETTAGKVEGGATGRGVVFRDIPYARPTQRWMPPEPAVPWTGVRDATVDGPAFPQAMAAQRGLDAGMSEDAARVYVWTPAADRARRPVMVWIPAGGWRQGSAAAPQIDGSNLSANGDVVVVSFNCRLGMLGALFVGDLLGDQYWANVGLLDQIAALVWVRDNIEAFGGDPANVTILGCSGGGFSVASLMAMPAARGLFHRAIIESGCYPVFTRDDANRCASDLLAALDLAPSEASKLLTVPFEALVDGLETMRTQRVGVMRHGHFWRSTPVRPCLDERTMPVIPDRAIAAGSAHGVSLLIGQTHEEHPHANLALAVEGTGLDAGNVLDLVCPRPELRDYMRTIARELGEPGLSPGEIYANAVNDLVFRVPKTRLAESQVVGGEAPVYMYRFAFVRPDRGGVASHGSEVSFVFDNLDAGPPNTFDNAGAGETRPAAPESARRVAGTVSRTWASFARSGNPNHDGIPSWPEYWPARTEMVIDEAWHAENDPYAKQRLAYTDVWMDRLFAHMYGPGPD